MNRLGLLATVLASALVAGCGGKQSVASKSAEAYREAVARGIPVGTGEHGGHANDHAAASSGMAGMAHAAMPGMEHMTTSGGAHDMSKMPGMQHGSTAGMASMPGMQHGSMSSMDQSKMQHGSMAGMNNMPGMAHGSMAGMDHSTTQHGSMAGMNNMPGMQHGSMAGMGNMAGMHHGAGTTTTPVVLGAPTSSSGIAKLNPSATLQEDQFDRPAPVAQPEAAKPETDHSHHDEGHS
jgi:hypothetical protein